MPIQIKKYKSFISDSACEKIRSRQRKPSGHVIRLKSVKGEEWEERLGKKVSDFSAV